MDVIWKIILKYLTPRQYSGLDLTATFKNLQNHVNCNSFNQDKHNTFLNLFPG